MKNFILKWSNVIWFSQKQDLNDRKLWCADCLFQQRFYYSIYFLDLYLYLSIYLIDG